MKTKLTETENYRLYQIAGEVEQEDVPSIAKVFTITAGTLTKHVVVDMSKCDRAVSTLFGVFLSFHKALDERGKTFVLCGVAPKVEALLETTKLNAFFIIQKNVNEAIEGLAE